MYLTTKQASLVPTIIVGLYATLLAADSITGL
jgi:hypothetical protein